MNRFHANLGLGGLVGGNMMNDNATTYDETFENIQASKILVWPQTNYYNVESNRIGPGKLGGTPFFAICDAPS